MKRLTMRHGQFNKGFSLLEMLVAVAVGSIVLLIIAAFVANGAGFFKKQMNSVNLQNELQEVSNKITDSIMEATSITVLEDSVATYIYTGDFSDTYVNKSDVETLGEGETWESFTNKSKQRCIMWIHTGTYAGNIYVFDREFFKKHTGATNINISEITFSSMVGTEDAIKDLEGYCITKYATMYDENDRNNPEKNSLTIQLCDDCLIEDVCLDEEGKEIVDENGQPVYAKATYTDLKGNTIYAYKQPARFQVNLTLVSERDVRSDMKTTSVRNQLTSLTIFGKKYGLNYNEKNS